MNDGETMVDPQTREPVERWEIDQGAVAVPLGELEMADESADARTDSVEAEPGKDLSDLVAKYTGLDNDGLTFGDLLFAAGAQESASNESGAWN
jgi:hypothetical protein